MRCMYMCVRTHRVGVGRWTRKESFRWDHRCSQLRAGLQQPALSPGGPPGANCVLFCCGCSFSPKVLSVQMLSSANPIKWRRPGVWLSPVSPDIFSG